MKRTVILPVFVLALALVGGLFASNAAAGQGTVTTQICFAMDGSGSIDSDGFTLMKDGLASAIQDPSIVPQDSSVEISVVQFAGESGSDTNTRDEVEPTVIDSATTAADLADDIANITQDVTGGLQLTPLEAGIQRCKELIIGSGNFVGASKRVINVITDGVVNNKEDTVNERENAVAAGIHEVHAEAIANAVEFRDVLFLLDLVWPQPGELVDPPSAFPPGKGFVVEADTISDFEAAIEQKVKLPPPVPATTTGGLMGLIAVLGLVLLVGIFGLNRRTAPKHP